ncbi:MAG: DUF2079 domain-containing protein [Patescibacteria group bacterium]
MRLSTIYQLGQQPLTWVVGSLILVGASLGLLVTIKYLTLGYNALDLSIFAATLEQTIRGHWLGSTIHPPSYWGDHASPFLLLLAPLWWLWSSPLLLLWLQVLALVAAAVPLYLIARRTIRSPWWAVVAPLGYLFNPLLWRAAMYEFHLLAFAPLLVFGAWYLYFFVPKKLARVIWFGVAIAAILSLREDTAFMVAGLAVVIGWHEYRSGHLWATWRWWLLPAIAAVVWFGLAQWIIGHFAPDGSYKFLAYYGWLGSSWSAVLSRVILHPLRVIGHLIFNVDHWQLIVGLLLPAGFLALLRPRALWIGTGSLAALLLAGSDSLVALTTHYHLPLTIALTLALVESLAALERSDWRFPKWFTAWVPAKFIPRWWPIAIVALATLLAWWPLGVWPASVTSLATGRVYRQALVDQLPVAVVAATTTPLPWLATQPTVLLADYLFIGQQQLSQQPYVAPGPIELLALDARDTLLWPWRFADRTFSASAYPTAHARLRQLLQTEQLNVVAVTDTLLLYRRNAASQFVPYVLTATPATNYFGCEPRRGGAAPTDFSCTVQFRQAKANTFLRYERWDHSQLLSARLLPLAYGLYRSDELKPTDRLTTTYRLADEDDPVDQVCISLVAANGFATYDRLDRIVPQPTSVEVLTSSCWPIKPSA